MAPLTKTLTTASLTTRLLRRQTLVALPPYYPYINNSLAPGTIIGIVLGSVAGFLMVLWLIYTCMQGLNPLSSSEVATSVVSTRRRSKTITRERSVRSERVAMRERSRSPRRETVRETVREVPIPVVVEAPAPGVERVGVVVEERRERRPSRRREDDDEVVVIEEHSPPPRRKKRRSHERRDSGGYRIVDPNAFAGGNPEEEIRRARRSRRMSGGRAR